MILPTMSYPRIAQELDTDNKELHSFLLQIYKSGKYQKIAKKHSNALKFKPIFWTSCRGNRYFIIPESNGKKELKKCGTLFFSTYCYYHDKANNLNMVAIIPGHYTFFRGHLFDRYQERFLRISYRNTLDVMVKFATRNISIASTPFETATKYKDSFFSRVDDGAVLGTNVKGFRVYNTFITNEMLKGSEINYSTRGQMQLNEMSERRRNGQHFSGTLIPPRWQKVMARAATST